MCKRCCRPVEGKLVKLSGSVFHPPCFTCKVRTPDILEEKLKFSLRAATSVWWEFPSTWSPTVRCTAGTALRSKIFPTFNFLTDNFWLQETRCSVQCLQVTESHMYLPVSIIANILFPDCPYYQGRERLPPPGSERWAETSTLTASDVRWVWF